MKVKQELGKLKPFDPMIQEQGRLPPAKIHTQSGQSKPSFPLCLIKNSALSGTQNMSRNWTECPARRTENLTRGNEDRATENVTGATSSGPNQGVQIQAVINEDRSAENTGGAR
jgi:hypothetical protein